MLHRARYCHGKLSVRLSVRPSVTLRYRNHIGWKSSKIISRLVSLWCSLSADHNNTHLLQGEHPEILAGIGDGYGKSGFRHTKALISVKRDKIGLRLLLTTNFDWYLLSIGAKMNLNSVSKHVRLSELTVKIWMKIHPHFQERRCEPMTVVSGNIRFLPIFEGVPWRGGVKQQWG